jgi:ubiquitin-protein ligase
MTTKSIIINQYNFTLHSNKYINYVTCDNKEISTMLLDKINVILSNSKNIDINDIISSQLHTNKTIQSIFNDYMGIFQESKITKFKLDKNNIYEKYIKNVEEKRNKSQCNIPKELLLNDSSFYKMLINEIEKVNMNMSHDHYIVCNNDNIFDLSIRIRYRENEISKIMKDFNKKYNYDYFELSFNITRTYPFISPKIDYIRPKIDLKLVQSIICMDIWDLANWNYTISLDHLITNLAIGLEHHLIKSIDINSEMNMLTQSPFNNIEIKLLHLSKMNKTSLTDIIPIDINIITAKQLKDTIKSNSGYWTQGTGYGGSNMTAWDINSYIDMIKLNMSETIDILNNIITSLTTLENYNINSILESYIITTLSGINILDFNKFHEYYHILISLIHLIITKNFTTSINFIDNIVSMTKDLYDIINNILSIDMTGNKVDTIDIYINTYIHFIDMINMCQKQITIIPTVVDVIIPSNTKDSYNEVVLQNQFGEYTFSNTHLYHKKQGNINRKSMLRIISETSSLRKNLPNCWDSSVILRISKTNFNMISFIITGPKDTPYHNGIFEFHAYFPDGYPSTVPEVLLCTTNGGTFRFNPNLYANGKVCLSLLGTWSGDVGESWNPELSTFLQVIISIQALILVENPFFNEPGYERCMNTNEGKIKSIKYNETIRIGTIKYAMINTIKNKIPSYETFIDNHFKLKKDEIIATVNTWVQECKYNVDEMKLASEELFSLLN